MDIDGNGLLNIHELERGVRALIEDDGSLHMVDDLLALGNDTLRTCTRLVS